MPETREIHGPATWMGPDLQDTTDWVHELDEGHREELLTALAAVEVAGLDFLEIGKDEFQLPTLGPMIEGLIDDEVLAGRGFVLLRGVPLDGLTERQIELMYWGLGNYFGMPLAQGEHATDLFAHVRDEGVDRNLNTGGGLLNKHSEALPFHTDSSDVVGLLCINPAMKGGASTIVSAAAVHNEILRTRPDLLEVMYEQFWFDRKRGDGPESFASARSSRSTTRECSTRSGLPIRSAPRCGARTCPTSPIASRRLSISSTRSPPVANSSST